MPHRWSLHGSTQLSFLSANTSYADNQTNTYSPMP